MIKTVATTILLTLALAAGALTSQPAMSVTKNLSSMPLAFTENQGQWDTKVKFRADAGGATMWFATNGAYCQFTRRINDVDPVMVSRPGGGRDGLLDQESDDFETMMIKATFAGANPNPLMVGEDELEYKCNYFLGDDPAAWRTDVANYSAVVYEDIYPGIDLKYYGNGREMEYDFIVSPGADFSRIQIQYEGVESLSVNDDGELVVETMWGEVIERRPVVYQERNGERIPIDGRYEIAANNAFGFSLDGDYDPAVPLVIDPVLWYSTYLGGSGIDDGRGIAVDASGAAYVTGDTRSGDFPTLNAYQSVYQDVGDAFVTKINIDGSLVYSTYLGGSQFERGYDVEVDASGAVYITGYTCSPDFPILSAYQETYQDGPYDAFVTKLNPGGDNLVYSTYLGGTAFDRADAIAVDGSGAGYIIGTTQSLDLPTQNAYQNIHQGGSYDAFVFKLSSDGENLVYSTYLGGGGGDVGDDIATDGYGAAYVTGYTASTDFPTQNAFQETYQGGTFDAFVTKLTSTGNSLDYSTYLGGDGGEYGQGIAVDATGAAYITGLTSSTDFPTKNAYQEILLGTGDAFVTKLRANGQSLVYSTYLGGSSVEHGNDIALDSTGNAYVSGETGSSDFPTVGEYQTYMGGMDVFITKLNSPGNALIYSTYLGGYGNEFALGIAVDPVRAACVTGRTNSWNFPTVNAYQETHQGGDWDAFVAKIGESCCLLRGDITHDGSVDPLDAVYFVNYLWRGGPPPPCMEEADVDGSGAVDPLDVIYLVNHFWNGGTPPVPCP